jgi:hypothetical protein
MGRKLYGNLPPEYLLCGGMLDYGARVGGGMIASFYSPSHALKRFARGWYGVGHTNRRQPGDMRGPWWGRRGGSRIPDAREEVMSRE